MGLTSLISNVPTFMMNLSSSIFSSGSTVNFLSAASSSESFMDTLFIFLAKLGYFSAKWMLYLLDILFSYIQQLCGLNMSFESLEKMVSKESDFVFNLLLTARDTITPIIRNLIGLAVALIIFFAILAVIRNIFNSSKNGGPADLKSVARDSIRALVLLIITPMLAIVGIIASNTILISLYNATNTSQSTSVSTQLFSASTVSANSYRIYAQSDGRIPITFDFSKDDEIIEYYESHPVTPEFREYMKSDQNLIYNTSKMFENATYYTFTGLNDVLSHGTGSIERNVNEYYGIYDRSAAAFGSMTEEGASKVDAYKKIQAYKPEYFVMADVIDFCIETGDSAYFKTIEEVLQSIVITNNERLLASTIRNYNIQFLNDDLKELRLVGLAVNPATQITTPQSNYIDLFNDGDWSVIRFTSTYYDADVNSEPVKKMDIQYNHVRGAVDELYGAKYIMALELVDFRNNVSTPYFAPLSIGGSVNGKFGFESKFIQRGQIVAAKGIFSESKFPTAITQSKDKTEVQFYRQNLSAITLGDTSQVAGGSLTVEKEEEKSGGFLSKIWDAITSLFKPKASATIDEQAIVITYKAETTTVNVLSAGKLSISYMFEDALSNGIGSVVTSVRQFASNEEVEQIGVFGLNLTNLYYANKINILVLVVGAFILIKITFTAVFALINRSYELFLTIMIYPTACATIPFDDNGYKQWTKTYTQRLFSTYGLILGVNFVLMLFPIISEIQFFEAGELALSKPLMRFRNLFNGVAKVATLGAVQAAISVEFLASFLNLIVVILFELVAFTLLETIPETISQITGASNVQGINPIESMGKVLKVMAGITKTVFTGIGGIKDILFAMVPTKHNRSREKIKAKIKEKADKALDGVKSFVPGSEIVRSAKDMKYLHDKKKQQKDAMKDLKEKLDSSTNSKEDIQKAFDAVLKSQQAYTNAINDPRKAREADASEQRKQDRLGLGSSRDDDEADEESGESEYKTDRELKKEKKRYDAIVKRLKKKEKREGLSQEEQKSLDTYTRLSDSRQNQMANRVSKSQFEQAQGTVQMLEAMKASGQTLTEDEEKQLESAQAMVDKYQDVQSKTSLSSRMAHAKEKKAEEKKATKEAEARKKMISAFSHVDLQSRMQQAKYLKEMDASIATAVADLEGINQDMNKVYAMINQDDEAFNASLEGIASKDVQAKIKALREAEMQKATMLGYLDREQQARVQRGVNLQEYKNRNANPNGKRKNESYADKEANYEADKADLEAKIAELKAQGISSGNIQEYNKLMAQKQKLESQHKYYTENWQPSQGKTKQELAQERNNRRQREQWEAEAVDELQEQGEALTSENIQKLVEQKRQEFLKKKYKKRKGIGQ